MKILPLIKQDLDYLFVGINPVEKSFINNKYHYFKSNSYFYTLLHKAGITDEKIDSTKLLDNNIGIVNYYYDYFGDTKNVPNKKKYRNKLKKYIKEYAPKKIIFLGKQAINNYIDMPENESQDYGFIGISLTCGEIYCVPFPTIPMKKISKIKYYKEIK